MKIENKIEGLNIGYHCDDNLLIYQNQNKICEYNLNTKIQNQITTIDNDFSGICMIDKSIVLMNSRGYQILNSNKEFEQFQERRIGRCELHDSQYLISKDKKSTTEWHMKIENIFTKEILWRTNQRENLRFINSDCYSFTITNISKRNIQTGDSIWSYQYNNDEFQPINLVANEHYLLLCLPKSDLLICIDNKLGQELWSRKSIPKGILIDEKNEYAHQMMINYSRFDLNTGEIFKSKVDREYFRQHKIENQKSNLLQINNYLIANDSLSKRTGALNLNTLEFDNWIDGISVPEGYKMRKNKEYIFLHGSDKTLNLVNMKAR